MVGPEQHSPPLHLLCVWTLVSTSYQTHDLTVCVTMRRRTEPSSKRTDQVSPRLFLIVFRLQLIYLQESFESAQACQCPGSVLITRASYLRESTIIGDIQELDEFLLCLLREGCTIRVACPRIKTFGCQISAIRRYPRPL